jgi:hypothetical protein
MALPSSVRSVIILPGDVRPSLIRPSDRDFYARFAPGALRAWGLRSDAEIAAVDHRLKWNGVVVPQMMFYVHAAAEPHQLSADADGPEPRGQRAGRR